MESETQRQNERSSDRVGEKERENEGKRELVCV